MPDQAVYSYLSAIQNHHNSIIILYNHHFIHYMYFLFISYPQSKKHYTTSSYLQLLNKAHKSQCFPLQQLRVYVYHFTHFNTSYCQFPQNKPHLFIIIIF